jgi:hypothetical protein
MDGLLEAIARGSFSSRNGLRCEDSQARQGHSNAYDLKKTLWDKKHGRFS